MFLRQLAVSNEHHYIQAHFWHIYNGRSFLIKETNNLLHYGTGELTTGSRQWNPRC